MSIELDRSETAERGASPQRRPLGRRLRPWAAALVVVCLLALGSAGRQPGNTLQHVADIVVLPQAEMISTVENLLISEPGTLAAYDPQTARQRWRVQTGLQQHWVQVEGDMLLVSGAGLDSGPEPSGAASIAVVASTGQVRWRIPGNLDRAGAFLVSHEISYTPFPVGRLTVYNLAAQRLWSADVVPTLHAVDSERQIVFTLHPTSGEMVEYRLDNGNIIGRTVVPEFVGAAGMFAGGGEMTVYFSDGRSETRRGSAIASQEPGGPFFPGRGERADCGIVWCTYSSSGMGMVLVDKTTGETVHDGEPWRTAIRTDFGVVGTAPSFDHGDPTVETLNVFDSATRRHRKIAGWSLMGINLQSQVDSWHGPVYLVAAAPPRTFFATLDAAGVHVAGSVPHEHLLQCLSTSRLVACRVDPETIKVWHLAP